MNQMIRLGFFRRFARSIAVLLLLSGPSGFQHAGKDDYACAPAVADSDGPSLSQAPDDAPEHCQVCHWTRSLRSRFASAVHIQYSATVVPDVRVVHAVAHRAPALDRIPARAPPQSI